MNTKDRKIDEKVRASYQAALSKDYEKAIALCREAIELDPACYQAWGNLVSFSRYMALSILKNETLPVYDQAIEFCPNDPLLWKEKAKILSFLGEGTEADKCLKQADIVRRRNISQRSIYLVDGTDPNHLPWI